MPSQEYPPKHLLPNHPKVLPVHRTLHILGDDIDYNVLHSKVHDFESLTK